MVANSRVRDLGSREHNKAAAANRPDNLDNPDSAVRLKGGNNLATSKTAVSQATRRVDVRPGNEA